MRTARIGAHKVIDALEAAEKAGKQLPKAITFRQWSRSEEHSDDLAKRPFAGKVLDAWAYERGVHLDLYPARETDREWIHRVVQRTAPR